MHSVKADEKQMESTADGALDPWSCLLLFPFLCSVSQPPPVTIRAGPLVLANNFELYKTTAQ